MDENVHLSSRMHSLKYIMFIFVYKKIENITSLIEIKNSYLF